KKIDFLLKLVNSQSNLLSVISNSLGSYADTELQDKTGANSADEDTQNNDNTPGTPSVIGITPNFTPVDVEKKLNKLLNGAEFTGNIWQQFSKPFNVCMDSLVKYLGENGVPMPRINPYPALKENNPNFWRFMIVQPHNGQTGGKRFLIPRNYDHYDPLWYEHLFKIKGNLNKPDNFIKGMVNCVILKNGELTGYIDKKLVEMKGTISVD
ncbi:MAG: hypothetical protein GY757_00525, partial [bacterium]|nr:hypothetical protein [bacterium]